MNQPEGVTHWEGPGLDAWRPWSAAQVADQLAGVTAPWCIVGGCAIDLWLGRQTRPHDDIEIAMPRGRFAEFRAVFSKTELHSRPASAPWPRTSAAR